MPAHTEIMGSTNCQVTGGHPLTEQCAKSNQSDTELRRESQSQLNWRHPFLSTSLDSMRTDTPTHECWWWALCALLHSNRVQHQQESPCILTCQCRQPLLSKIHEAYHCSTPQIPMCVVDITHKIKLLIILQPVVLPNSARMIWMRAGMTWEWMDL